MYWKILPAALLLGGCNLTVDKNPGASASAVSAKISEQKKYELDMAAEWRKEDRILQFISNGTYRCGYPESSEVKDISNNKVKTKQIEDRYKLIKGSIAVIDEYAKSLKAFQERKDELEGSIKALAGAIKLFSRLPGAPNADALVSAGQSIALSSNSAASSLKVAALAQLMQEPLESSVASIKAWYPAQEDEAGRIFNQWDNCALEKLYYIRDVPNKLVGDGKYKAYFERATGIELDFAFQEYIKKREKFRRPGPIDDHLKEMLDQNEKLAKVGSWEAATKLVDLIATLEENM